MKELRVVIIEFLISFSTCAFASLQAEAFTCSCTGKMSLTTTKDLAGKVKE